MAKKIFLDATRNEIKEGFYTELRDAMPQRDIYYFSKQVTKTREDGRGFVDTTVGWEGFVDGKQGLTPFFLDNTEDFAPIPSEQVRERVRSLAKRIEFLERYLPKS